MADTPYTISLTIKELKKRENKIRLIVSALTSERLASRGWSPSSSSYFITLYKGDKNTQFNPNPRSYFFKTYSSNIQAQYIEQWQKIEPGLDKKWVLQNIMLNMYRISADRQEKEIFCLHSEPSFIQQDLSSETNQRRKIWLTKQQRYKRLLHIHVSEAQEPINHAHLSLHVGYDDEILKSEGTLNKALTNALEMIKNELLEVSFCKTR